MAKVLYITNQRVPYRNRFFTLWAEECELLVVYEQSDSGTRNDQWAQSGESGYKNVYLDSEVRSKSLVKRALRLCNIVKSDNWDCVIFCCVNSPIEALVAKWMQLTGRKFWMNLDGELFLRKGLKGMAKKAVLAGAEGILCKFARFLGKNF